MKKWLIAFTASAVLIGCGGGNGLGGSTSGGSTGTNGGGSGNTLPTSLLSGAAQGQVLYLTGQGRRAASQIALLDNIRVYNSVNDFQPTDSQGSGSPLRLRLDGYTLNQFVFDVPVGTGSAGKTYTQFPLEVAKMEDTDGAVLYSGPPVLFTPFFNLNMQLLPGRQTTIQVVLNDQILKFDGADVVLDRAAFEAENYAPFNNKINGFLSDMVSFDVSALPATDRPVVSNGDRADIVHFSGDSIGISGQFRSENGEQKATFDMLNPVVIDSGKLLLPKVIGGRQAPGVYTVMEPDPRDPFGNAKIVALQGIYRKYTEVLGNLSTFQMVALPTTRSTTTSQVVLFNRDAQGTITAMWQGIIDYNKATKGTLRLFSLDQLPDATATPRASGEVNFTKVNGVVKNGTFTISVAPPNFPFPTKGGFMVLR